MLEGSEELRAFLWCNGDMPSLEMINSLGRLTPLFGVDGGTKKAESCGFLVEETLGDLDSIKEYESDSEMKKLNDDSCSDLTKTILELSKRGYTVFDILGIDGGSPGHILGIWGTMVESPEQLEIRLHHNNATSYRITPGNNDFQINLEKDQLFSAYALTKCEKISIRGAQWELDNDSLNMSTRGLHNRANGGILSIKGDGIIALIIEH